MSDSSLHELSDTTRTATSEARQRNAASDWYKDAVIYQLHVRSFFDSDGDGVGDFVGLTEKLEYVAALGVTAIWLLPFYPSPLRDEGYDIADYYNVNPLYGTLNDFRRFLDRTHRLGLRVITELVINHTSDQHPWFQRARHAPKGSPDREFYVWNDTAERYQDVRVIFQDFEPSNWTWDSVAKQNYWHRFYSHQPDLNFDHEPVQQAVLDVLDFWFDMGIDGLRLDAVPYLFERDGTNCENLPETHAFLRRLRAHVDSRHPGHMLLAEANQWPADTAAYFGDDDECHMCFNFPLMPRLFMALQQEERFPIVDVVQHTPSPPPQGQWAVFLRNHDELTLEMVTDEERDAMYRFYATDPRARVNLGLRRRLAPLLRNDRRRLELMHALLFALPGTPVMYYGDEIRMGDNIYLHDRDSVRTPMQWSADRNGGFSRANPQRLFLSPVTDPQFHFLSCNVETEEQSPHSLLWWLRRILHLRGEHRSFGRGTIEFLLPQNPRVLVFLRNFGDETLLCVFNLSRSAQFVELNLSDYRGRTPVELFAKTRFPMIGDLPYLLTVGPHGFYWFRLGWPQGEEERRGPADLPQVTVEENWTDVFRRPTVDDLNGALQDYLVRQPWHVAPRNAVIRKFDVVAVIPHGDAQDDGDQFAIVLVRVHYVAGEPATYQLPIVATRLATAEAILNDRPTAGLFSVNVTNTSSVWYVCDATAERTFWSRWAADMATGAVVDNVGRLEHEPTVDFPSTATDPSAVSVVRRLGASKGNSAATVGSELFLTLIRRIESGIHPVAEVGAVLQCFNLPMPKLRGTCRFRRADVGVMTLGFAHDLVPHEQPLVDICRQDVQRAFDTLICDVKPTSVEPTLTALAGNAFSAESEANLVALIAPLQSWFVLLGRQLARVHLTLQQMPDTPAFKPDSFSLHYRQSLNFGYRSQSVRTLAALKHYLDEVPELRDRPESRELGNSAARAAQCYASLSEATDSIERIRCHGSLDLNDVLLYGDDLHIVSWEADPLRSLTDRRIKRCVLVDLAAIVQSLSRVVVEVYSDWVKLAGISLETAAFARGWSWQCVNACGDSLTTTYRGAVAGRQLVPESDREFTSLFAAYRLNTAMRYLQAAVEREPVDRVWSAIVASLEALPAGDASETLAVQPAARSDATSETL